MVKIACTVMMFILAAAAAAAAAEETPLPATEPGAPPGASEAVAPAVPRAGEMKAENAGPSAPAAPEGKTVAVSSYLHEVGRKLKRGTVNLARAGTEFYVQPMEAKRESGKRLSMLWPGGGEALGMFLTRLTGGLIEAATCAVPFPSGWQPLLDE